MGILVSKSKLRKLLKSRNGKFVASAGLLVFIAGMWALFSISPHADTSTTASFQAENGTKTGVATVTDGTAAGGSAISFGMASTATGNVTVNFNQQVMTLAQKPFSGTISTYGSDGGSIARSSKQRTQLGNLGLGFYRIPLQWNGGNIISSAGGGPRDVSGDAWVNAVTSFGGVPMIVLGGSEDNNFSPSDAAGMVQHFNGTNGPKVTYWVVGNEPGNGGMSIATYCTLFNNTVDAMKAVDSSIKVAGPAWAFFDSNNIRSFLQCAGNKVDIIDYHHYGMGTTYLSNEEALSQTAVYKSEVEQTRALIQQYVPARANQIDIQVGEFNWSWRTGNGYQGYNGDDRFYQPAATVWTASVAGNIMVAGARGHQYSDQNGALGITFEKNADASHFGRTLNDPMPGFWGMQMFSGGNLFRGFGTSAVQTSTSLQNVDVFASNNPKNIVLINKSPTNAQAATVALNGAASTSASIWQTNKDLPFNAPANIATSAVSGGTVQVSLPPYSVTTIVLN